MSHKKISFSTYGFTLIELLIAIAIIGIIAVVAFVALDPARRFAEARNSTRWEDVASVLDSIKLYTVDQRGAPPWPTTGTADATNRIAVNGTRFMIGSCSTLVECTVKACAAGAVTGTYGIPLTLLTSGSPAYLAAIPISQALPGAAAWTAPMTGYYLVQNANGGTQIGACDGEVGANITITK